VLGGAGDGKPAVLGGFVREARVRRGRGTRQAGRRQARGSGEQQLVRAVFWLRARCLSVSVLGRVVWTVDSVDGNTGDGRSGQTSDAGPHESQPGVEESRDAIAAGRSGSGPAVSEPSANGYSASESQPGQARQALRSSCLGRLGRMSRGGEGMCIYM
jgi:hypothetical protein